MEIILGDCMQIAYTFKRSTCHQLIDERKKELKRLHREQSCTEEIKAVDTDPPSPFRRLCRRASRERRLDGTLEAEKERLYFSVTED